MPMYRFFPSTGSRECCNCKRFPAVNDHAAKKWGEDNHFGPGTYSRDLPPEPGDEPITEVISNVVDPDREYRDGK